MSLILASQQRRDLLWPLPVLQLGYHVYPKELTSLMGAVKSAASHTYSCAPAPVQYAAAQVGPAVTLALLPLVTLLLLQPLTFPG